MEVLFFKGKKGNWICPAANGELIVANGEMTAKDLKTALEKGEGRKVGDNLLIGFAGSETITVDVKAVKGQDQAETSKPVITWEEF